MQVTPGKKPEPSPKMPTPKTSTSSVVKSKAKAKLKAKAKAKQSNSEAAESSAPEPPVETDEGAGPPKKKGKKREPEGQKSHAAMKRPASASARDDKNKKKDHAEMFTESTSLAGGKFIPSDKSLEIVKIGRSALIDDGKSPAEESKKCEAEKSSPAENAEGVPAESSPAENAEPGHSAKDGDDDEGADAAEEGEEEELPEEDAASLSWKFDLAVRMFLAASLQVAIAQLAARRLLCLVLWPGIAPGPRSPSVDGADRDLMLPLHSEFRREQRNLFDVNLFDEPDEPWCGSGSHVALALRVPPGATQPLRRELAVVNIYRAEICPDGEPLGCTAPVAHAITSILWLTAFAGVSALVPAFAAGRRGEAPAEHTWRSAEHHGLPRQVCRDCSEAPESDGTLKRWTGHVAQRAV
eukprot:s1311_g19.t1